MDPILKLVETNSIICGSCPSFSSRRVCFLAAQVTCRFGFGKVSCGKAFRGLGVVFWITCGPIFVPAEVILLDCKVVEFSFRGPKFCNNLPDRTTCALVRYIIRVLGLGKVE